MDQYFVQLEKIIEKKKISSRIKFAMKDIIDLRASNWVPRTNEEINPKTIDQIHREMQQKTKKGIYLVLTKDFSDGDGFSHYFFLVTKYTVLRKLKNFTIRL